MTSLGTGHGVGSFLNVHEGPIGISSRLAANLPPLKAGMIVTDEPGYYENGNFGIRIENLQVVTKPMQIPGGDRPMLGFESLTSAPIDLTLVVAEMLSPDEINWLDAYHAKVRETHLPHLSGEVASWLIEATRKVSQNKC